VPGTPPWNLWKELLNRAERGEFDTADAETKARVASEFIRACSSAAAVLALQPFTGVDSALVTPLHYRMVCGVARIHGYAVDARATYAEILWPLRAKIVTHHLGMMAAKFVPFTNLLAVPVAYGLTCAIGGVSAEYYARGRALEPREMRTRFSAIYKRAHGQAYKEKRNEFRAMFRSPEVRRQIEELRKERHDGTADADDVERKVEEILREDEERAGRGRR
jgi:uncharacterized protein (DUF697 family)